MQDAIAFKRPSQKPPMGNIDHAPPSMGPL